MEEWKTYKLGDVCKIYGRIGFRGYTIEDLVEDSEKGAISLSPTNIQGGVLDLSKPTYISWEKYHESPEIMIHENDIVIVKTGSSIGRTAIIRNISHPMTLNPQLVVLKDVSINKHFLGYLVKGKDFQGKLSSIVVGSAIPTLSQKNLANLTIAVPPTRVQEKIANILSALDSKIELNNRINHNLEEQAQALFDNYFIHNTIDLGDTKTVFLTDIATYLNGLAMQKFPAKDKGLPVLKIKELGQGYCDNSSDRCSSDILEKYIINDGDCIFSWSGTLLVDLWCGGQCGLNQHLFKVSSDNYPKWFYYLWTKHHLDTFIHIAKDKAVTMGHIKRSELEKAIVIMPSKEKLDNLSKLFEPIINQIIQLRIMNRTLAQQRDELLPKLMSGELKINEIDC